MEEKRPNILWICTDQQRYDTIGALGNEHIRTPHLDRLVSHGTAFSHTFCQSTICTPSRASFMTGMYCSTAHGCMNGNNRWSEAAPLISKLLADEGYDCGLAGKLHLAGAAKRAEPRPKEDGYRVFEWSHSTRDRWEPGVNEYVDWAKSQGAQFGGDDDCLLNATAEVHQTTWCANRAIDFIEHAGSSPWMMSVNIFDPHKPFDPPEEYQRRYNPENLPDPLFRDSDFAAQEKLAGVEFQNGCRHPDAIKAREIKAAYYAMIELIDDNVGRMMEALERSGQRENTIAIFMSDHGEMLGDHGLLLKGCRFYEGLVRVPLIFSWPGHIRENRVCDDLVELVDVAPTLLELCGGPVPAHIQSKSLAPLLRGESDGAQHRDSVRCEYYRALQKGGLGLEHGLYRGNYATMIREKQFKLVVYHGQGIGELFDLESDPGEFTNLWDEPDYAAIRFRLLNQSFDSLAFAVDLGPEADRQY
jgi:arylsulfatase A-like enzyme